MGCNRLPPHGTEPVPTPCTANPIGPLGRPAFSKCSSSKFLLGERASSRAVRSLEGMPRCRLAYLFSFLRMFSRLCEVILISSLPTWLKSSKAHLHGRADRHILVGGVIVQLFRSFVRDQQVDPLSLDHCVARSGAFGGSRCAWANCERARTISAVTIRMEPMTIGIRFL